MRFSAAALLALPLLAAAETQSPLVQAQDTAKHYFDLIYSFIPHSNTYSASEAAAAKADGKNINVLTLNNWRSTLRNSVTAASEGPEEWWVLLTGGDKSCWGNCTRFSEAFYESAALLNADASAPHLGLINCEHQPVLCHSWATGAPRLYIFEMTPEPAPVSIHVQTFNSSTITANDFVELHTSNSWKERPEYEGFYHPFNGDATKYGLDLATGWLIWSFNILPNWAFMILLSFASRSMMNRRNL